MGPNLRPHFHSQIMLDDMVHVQLVEFMQLESKY